MHGLSGVELFNTIFYKYILKENYNKSKFKEISCSINSYISNNIEGTPFAFGHAGLAGILWALSYFESKGVVKYNKSFFFSDLEPHLDRIVISEAKNKNYDFFYGIAGIIIFYNEANLLHKKTTLQREVIDLLYSQAIEIDNNTLTWSFFTYEPKLGFSVNNDKINLGMSHGLPALICILLKFNNEFDPLIKPLVEKSINFILKSRRQNEIKNLTISEFPYYKPTFTQNLIEDYYSRLAWCYGDLGICIMLWNASVRFNNPKWRDLSTEIMINCSKRKDLKINNIKDAGFCHGTSGIAHIFNRFYYTTKSNYFKDAREYWIRETLHILDKYHKVYDYLPFNPEDNNVKDLNKTSGLLEGISGIGLTLIGYLEPESTDWDNTFLIR